MISNYEKFKNFLNDEDNILIIRLAMAILGIIIGSAFVLLSILFENPIGSITFLVFGCITFGGFMLAPVIWYLNEN